MTTAEQIDTIAAAIAELQAQLAALVALRDEENRQRRVNLTLKKGGLLR